MFAVVTVCHHPKMRYCSIGVPRLGRTDGLKAARTVNRSTRKKTPHLSLAVPDTRSEKLKVPDMWIACHVWEKRESIVANWV